MLLHSYSVALLLLFYDYYRYVQKHCKSRFDNELEAITALKESCLDIIEKKFVIHDLHLVSETQII